ncbi:MAG: LD-carboxypeptidase [Bacteroidetes bacterium]|nr:LD-carboxypeptidase [Bacteroidota bacterium]
MTAYPPYLKKGSLIGITCPAGFVSNERVFGAIDLLQQQGFRVKVGETVGSEHFYFSGTDEQRRNDLQTMLDDPNIDAILMGRGGYGTSRIIDQLDFTAFCLKPKWICGFSDICVLHSHIQANFQIPTFHSPMSGAFSFETLETAHVQQFFSAIMGLPLSYTTPPSAFNRRGNADGILVGGNLAILTHLTGSSSELQTEGNILFIEDIGEHLYQIDRMLMNLKRSGKLNRLKGLIVGSFTEIEDTERPFGQTLEEIIFSKVQEFSYPVCFNFPAGHQQTNYTLTLGMRHKLIVTEQGGSLMLSR